MGKRNYAQMLIVVALIVVKITKCPTQFPGNFWEMSGNFPGNFRDISGTFPGKFPGNFREVSGKFPGKNPGKFRKKSVNSR